MMGMLYEYTDPYEKDMINQPPQTEEEFLGNDGNWGDLIDPELIHDFVYEEDEYERIDQS
jgi:hypothetical protein